MRIKRINFGGIKTFTITLFFVIMFIFTSTLTYKIYQFAKIIQIQEITILGASEEVKSVIYSKISFLKGKKVLDVNLENLQSYINSFPWIQQSSAKRYLSGKIEIQILERNPYFLWKNEEGVYKVINSDNSPVKVSLKFPLESLIALEQGNEALEKSHKIRFVIYQDTDILQQIQKLEFNGYRWNVYLKNGLYIKMPENNLEKAYDKFLAMNKKYNLLEKDIEYIDVTSVNKIFVMPNNKK